MNLSIEYFARQPQMSATSLLLAAGSGDWGVPGVIMNKLWAEKITQYQYIENHMIYDHISDKHYVCMVFIAPDGMITTVHSDAVVIKASLTEPTQESLPETENK